MLLVVAFFNSNKKTWKKSIYLRFFLIFNLFQGNKVRKYSIGFQYKSIDWFLHDGFSDFKWVNSPYKLLILRPKQMETGSNVLGGWVR